MYVNNKIRSTEALLALNLADGTYAAMENDKTETLNKIFISVFTTEPPG